MIKYKKQKSLSWGDKIKQSRLGLELSVQDFAIIIGKTPQTVYNWEGEKNIPSENDKTDVEKKIEKYELLLQKEYRQEDNSWAAWLRKNREKNNMTVRNLSEKSNVSIPTIYNIENGKILYPQENTIIKLSETLNIGDNDKINQATSQPQTVDQIGEGIGALADFSAHSEDEWPNCSGVYVFYDIAERPIYVGQSENIKKRLRDHADKFWFKRPIVELASYIEISDKKLRTQIEQILIKFLKSNAIINKRDVDKK